LSFDFALNYPSGRSPWARKLAAMSPAIIIRQQQQQQQQIFFGSDGACFA
jgi:hypothetical protein